MIPLKFPIYLSAAFMVVVLFTLLLLGLTIAGSAKPTVRKRSWKITAIAFAWIVLQSVLSVSGLYSEDPDALPPKIILFGVFPMLLLIACLLLTKKGKLLTGSLPLVMLTYLHVIRIPVELVLYGLYLKGAIPELMTFEGRNFDILAGITAPFVAYFGIGRGLMSRRWLLAWNFICLGLLLNIVFNAILSAPSPFQQFAFSQPNIAILHFPFSLLPAFVVPVVLFAHLATIRQLLAGPK